LECLSADNATDFNEATKSTGWKLFADNSLGQASKSPVVDSAEITRPALARFIKLLISGSINLLYIADEADPINARNALSVFELKVFGRSH